MEEKDKNEISGSEAKVGEDGAVMLGFREKAANFWYYYKWHVIVGVFLLTVLVIGLAQCKTRVEFDGYILYAGNHEIKRTGEGGDTAPYNKMLTDLKKISSDRDGDGIVNLDLRNLFVVNKEEADELIGGDEKLELNEALVNEDTKTLGTVILYGEYYLCFLSERLFLEYDGKHDGQLFADLTPYLTEGNSYSFVEGGARGVYLSSLKDFYALPEISKMPEDTVVCLRALSEVSLTFNKNANEKYFAWGEDMMKKLLAYE